MPGARYQAAPSPDGDPAAVRSGAHALGAIAGSFDRVAHNLGLAAADLTQGPGSWQGDASQAFVALSDSVRDAAAKSAGSFRELAGALNGLAGDLERAQEKRMEADAISGAFMLLLIGDIIQAGVDVPEDAATVAAAGAASRLTVEAVEIASQGAARAALNFERLAAVLTLRGLTSFAVAHVGAAVVAGGQTALIEWITNREIDWKSVGVNVFIAGLLSVPLARVGRPGTTVVIDEKAALQGAKNLNVIAENPALADEAVAATAAKPPLQFADGYEAERYLEVAVGGRKQAKFKFDDGRPDRRVDLLDQTPGGPIAFESKVGYTSLDSEVTSEIERDQALLEDGRVKEIFWVFGRSAKTGKMGASRGLLNKLDAAGIKYTTFDDLAG